MAPEKGIWSSFLISPIVLIHLKLHQLLLSSSIFGVAVLMTRYAIKLASISSSSIATKENPQNSRL